MRWEKVRKIYPIDEAAPIRTLQYPQETTKELLQSKDGIIVSHTDEPNYKAGGVSDFPGFESNGYYWVLISKVNIIY